MRLSTFILIEINTAKEHIKHNTIELYAIILFLLISNQRRPFSTNAGQLLSIYD